jgi:MFS family permease
MYGFSSLPAWTGWLIIGAGAAGMIVFVRGARTSEAPLFDVNLFAGNRVFAFSCLASFIAYSSTFGISYLMSLYLQYLKGLTPQAAGTVMVAQPVMMALFSPFSGRMADRFEPRHIASLGLLLVAAGLALLSRLQSGSPLIHVVAGLMLVGFGFALFSPPNVHAIMSSVDSRHLGTASGSVGTARVLGQTFSMGIVSLVFAVMMGPVHLTPQHFAALSHSISDSFAVAACLSFAGVFLSLARGDLHGTAR